MIAPMKNQMVAKRSSAFSFRDEPVFQTDFWNKQDAMEIARQALSRFQQEAPIWSLTAAVDKHLTVGSCRPYLTVELAGQKVLLDVMVDENAERPVCLLHVDRRGLFEQHRLYRFDGTPVE